MSEEEKRLSNKKGAARAVSTLPRTALAPLSLPAGPGDSSQDTVSVPADLHVSTLPEACSGSWELAAL